MKRWLLLVCIFWIAPVSSELRAEQPIITDSRIKTLLYNENDVYSVTTHYGYQTNIEFGKNEEVQTISLGDRIAWQVIPYGQRLFIRAMENDASTNMTVITNKRAYQFDLHSTDGKRGKITPEIAYVIRFYYPEDQPRSHFTGTSNAAAFAGELEAAAQPAASNLNFQYSFTGPDQLAPLKIFDNGRNVFFRLHEGGSIEPRFSVPAPDGQEQAIPVSQTSAGYYVTSVMAPRYIVRYGNEIICIYNDRL